MRTKRSLRLPLQTIATLRDLRDSHIGGRPLPELVRCCLKQTDGVANVLKVIGTTREGSEKLDVTLDHPHSTLDHSTLVARVCHALIGVQATLDHRQMAITRGQYEFQ